MRLKYNNVKINSAYLLIKVEAIIYSRSKLKWYIFRFLYASFRFFAYSVILKKENIYIMLEIKDFLQPYFKKTTSTEYTNEIG